MVISVTTVVTISAILVLPQSQKLRLQMESIRTRKKIVYMTKLSVFKVFGFKISDWASKSYICDSREKELFQVSKAQITAGREKCKSSNRLREVFEQALVFQFYVWPLVQNFS